MATASWLTALLNIIMRIVEWFVDPKRAERKREEADDLLKKQLREAMAVGDTDAACRLHAELMRRLRERKARRADRK